MSLSLSVLISWACFLNVAGLNIPLDAFFVNMMLFIVVLHTPLPCEVFAHYSEVGHSYKITILIFKFCCDCLPTLSLISETHPIQASSTSSPSITALSAAGIPSQISLHILFFPWFLRSHLCDQYLLGVALCLCAMVLYCHVCKYSEIIFYWHSVQWQFCYTLGHNHTKYKGARW